MLVSRSKLEHAMKNERLHTTIIQTAVCVVIFVLLWHFLMTANHSEKWSFSNIYFERAFFMSLVIPFLSYGVLVLLGNTKKRHFIFSVCLSSLPLIAYCWNLPYLGKVICCLFIATASLAMLNFKLYD